MYSYAARSSALALPAHLPQRSKTTTMASTFRKKLYLHDPTPEELAADAAREQEARKAEQKAAKKSTLPR